MSTQSGPKTAPLETLADPEVRHGAQAYSSVLQGAGGEQVQALVRGAEARAVCAALYAAPAYDLQVPGMAVSRLSLNLTPARVVGGTAGDHARSFDAQRYSLFLAPAGAPMNWRKEAASRHLTIYFHARTFEGCERADSPLTKPQALHNFSVPGLRPLAEQLACELRHGGPYDSEAADCLARLMLIQISRHLVRAQDSAKVLSTAAMTRLRDYVMAHLGERVLVADLARQVGMSINHFTWECKAQTGESPHQFVLALRLKHANQLLRTSNVSIANVALACGFSSQQHLTNAMRRHTGITPARYRGTNAPEIGRVHRIGKRDRPV